MKASPFRIESKETLRPVTCVYQLNFKNKYFIFKGLKLNQSVENLSKQLDREIRSPKEDSILYKVVAYVRRYPVSFGTVSIIKETDDYVDLLSAEHEALNEAKEDPNCLNLSFNNTDYFPKWIPQQIIVDFKAKLEGLSNRKALSKDVYFRRFLSKFKLKQPDQDKIFDYVIGRYR